MRLKPLRGSPPPPALPVVFVSLTMLEPVVLWLPVILLRWNGPNPIP